MRGLRLKEISLGLALVLTTGACATTADALKDEAGITIQAEQDENRTAVDGVLGEPEPPKECENEGLAIPVERVIDGDTIDVICDGVKERIRIIGINTPETVHPNKPVECFGKQASARMKALLSGKKVILKQGPGSENRGKYGRLLRYVELDGKDVGAQLIEEGHAFSYGKYPHSRLDQYRELERQARESGAGLWATDACPEYEGR